MICFLIKLKHVCLTLYYVNMRNYYRNLLYYVAHATYCFVDSLDPVSGHISLKTPSPGIAKVLCNSNSHFTNICMYICNSYR